MRRLFLLSLFVLSVFSVQAQPKWGTWSVVPHVGVSFANLTNEAIGVADNRISHSQTRIGFSGGADVYYQLTDKLALSGGVAYTFMYRKAWRSRLVVSLLFLQRLHGTLKCKTMKRTERVE